MIGEGSGRPDATGQSVAGSADWSPKKGREVRIWPSLLAADLANLAGAARSVPHAFGLHVDMMDGRFVPNLTMGPPVLASLRRHTNLPLEAHLMVEHAEDWLEDLSQAGTARVMVHAEASVHLERTLAHVRELGMEAMVALNPATPIETLRWVAPILDGVLVMTVNPGFGGQRMIPQTLEKVAQVRELLDLLGRDDVRISVDGGMDPDSALRAVRQGARDIVAGSSIFGMPDPDAAVQGLLQACAGSLRGVVR